MSSVLSGFSAFRMTDPAVRHLNLQVEEVALPSFPAVSLTTLKDALHVQHSEDDEELLRLMAAATRMCEGKCCKVFLGTQFSQIQDQVPNGYALMRRPVQSIDKIEYMPDEDSVAWVELATTYYYLAGKRVAKRSSWPSARSMAGWKTTFTAGLIVVPENPDAAEILACQAALHSDLQTAICQLTGHLYENKEGEGPDPKYEVIAKNYGPFPQNVSLLLERHMDRSLT